MPKLRAHHTISEASVEYLKKFPNQSKVIDEAIELHRNKDKLVLRPLEYKVSWYRNA